MSKIQKTFFISKTDEIRYISHDNNYDIEQNKIMIKRNKNIKLSNKSTPDCNIHVMPNSITDEDISALMSGVIRVIKKKFELDTRSEIIAMNYNIEKLIKELNESKKECNRLKNEIIYLKSKMNENA